MNASVSTRPGSARKPLVLVPQHFGSIVFDRRTSRYLPFDAEATALLLRLETMPFPAILTEIQDPERREALIRFFEQFYDRGFFTLDLRFDGTTLDVAPPADHLTGPLALHLEIVAACNLKCRHCFAGELPRRDDPLTLDELDSLFAIMARMGTFRLGLTGGEPLLRRDLFDIIDLALAHGLCPCLTTNGLLITEAIAREFGKRTLAWLNVSLDGACAETNDGVRGSGTFDRVLERLTVLGKHARFSLAFTVMRTNLEEIQACAALAAKVGAHTAVFRPLYPVGTACQNMELMPTFSEYHNALNELAGASGDVGGDLRGIDSFGPHTRLETQSVVHQNYGCGAGNLVCSISVSGDVNPCSFLGPGFNAANLRERSLEEIWHDSHGFRSIRALPGPADEAFEAPDHTAVFSGGCRARALYFNGSLNAPDPWCTDQKEQAGSLQERGREGHGAVRHPLVILEIPGSRPAAE
jgi:radical SAM protein with 4Fe4S-binding SPASM domain